MSSNLKGILLAFAAAFAVANVGLVVKLLSGAFGPVSQVIFRNVFALVVLVPFLLITGRAALLKTAHLKKQMIRAALGTVGMLLMVTTVSMIPIAEATVFSFTSPLWVVVLSVPLLGEKVGKWRVASVIIGFIGVVIFAGPDTNIPPLGLISGLSFGVVNALVSLCLRWMGKTEDAFTTVFYFCFLGLIPLFPFMDQDIQAIDLNGWLLGALLGVVSLISLTLKTEAFRHAPAALISPIWYSMLIWALIYDYIFFDETPSFQTIAGGVIIIASNLVILWREQKAKAS